MPKTGNKPDAARTPEFTTVTHMLGRALQQCKDLFISGWVNYPDG